MVSGDPPPYGQRPHFCIFFWTLPLYINQAEHQLQVTSLAIVILFLGYEHKINVEMCISSINEVERMRDEITEI